MGRTRKSNRQVWHPKPVEKVELSEKHTKLRLILVILFVAVGASAFAYGVFSLFQVDAGWAEIKTASSKQNCGSEFVFLYRLGEGGVSPAKEKRAVTALYSQAAEQAYQLFTNDLAFDGVHNPYYINRHPNEVMEVDETLYQAFSLLQSYGDRSLYLAPVYERYSNVFDCTDDSQTVEFDPYLNRQVAAEYREIAAYANDREAVDIELMGDCQIRLKVSDGYLAYAEENGIESYVDFFWLKNAFVVDYLADTMLSNGYTRGCISSLDGFVRNLDGSGTSYSFSVTHRVDGVIYPAALMQYQGPVSLICLRDYGMSDADSQRYYERRDGEIRTPYLDTQDGLCKSSCSSLICYGSGSAAGTLLQMLPVYIADSLQEEKIEGLAKEGIYSVYCEDGKVLYNDPSLTFSNLYQEADVSYQTELMG